MSVATETIEAILAEHFPCEPADVRCVVACVIGSHLDLCRPDTACAAKDEVADILADQLDIDESPMAAAKSIASEYILCLEAE